MNALLSKTRRPKFELVLKIIDLNNVPLVSGTSYVKWHLPSSTAAEHRGRTEKAPIKEHKVIWNYEKVIAARLVIDKTSMLQDFMVNFEVLQDYSTAARDEKITLGHVSLNLAEYTDLQSEDGEDGVARRYLMQESKINSTLKIGISMRQLDGERDYRSPPLKVAPSFGCIAGIMDFEQAERDDIRHIHSMNRSHEAAELQQMYRLTLAASWVAQPGELPADECIEAIFAGGTGWSSKDIKDELSISRDGSIRDDQHSDEGEDRTPRHREFHRKTHSVGSSRSRTTITGKNKSRHKYSRSRESRGSLDSHRHGSSTEGSDRAGFQGAYEVDEFEAREDLRAWKLPRYEE